MLETLKGMRFQEDEAILAIRSIRQLELRRSVGSRVGEPVANTSNGFDAVSQ